MEVKGSVANKKVAMNSMAEKFAELKVAMCQLMQQGIASAGSSVSAGGVGEAHSRSHTTADAATVSVPAPNEWEIRFASRCGVRAVHEESAASVGDFPREIPPPFISNILVQGGGLVCVT